MSNIKIAGEPSNIQKERRMVPMQIGNATVYVEALGASVETGGEIHVVAASDPKKVFENAVDAIHECVRMVGEKIGVIAENLRPQEVTAEFSLTFEASGKASVIPIFVTGETKVSTGLKITAAWKSDVKTTIVETKTTETNQ